MAQKSRIFAEVDFDADGKQHGFLRLPHSVHRSAYGWIGIPITVIKNGNGPTVLLAAGNHGDEYEGQLALMKLCQELQPEAVQGRIIITTATNFPAVIAGTRTSPLDAGNLNRSFPGDPNGTPTEVIAHYFESELLQISDYMVDLHSGGSSLMYIPSALARHSTVPDIESKQIAMLKAFGAPLAYFPGVTNATGDDRTAIAGAIRHNVAAIGSELGGSGTTSVFSLKVAEQGVRRVLKHLEVVPECEVEPSTEPTRLMEVPGLDYYTYSPDYGIWELLADLGDEVKAGQPATSVFCPETPWREPTTTHFDHDGLIICRRVPGPVHRGDCLFHLATDI
jgi:predicted deacylase